MFSLKAVFTLLRPKHWFKNILVFAPLIFALRSDTELYARTALTFLALCAASSFVYTVNDLVDAPADRLHPEKKRRPIASGQIKPPLAVLVALILLIISFTLARLLPESVTLVLLGYLALNLAYSFGAKKLVLIDVMIIAIGFVLRVVAGGLTGDIPVSNWILLCTFSGSLFLGFGKRKHENGLLEENSKNHRQVLEHYTHDFLNQLISVTAATTIICYALYTIDSNTVARFHTDKLIYTLPFVVYGIFHYFHLIYNHATGGDPAQIILKDRPAIITALLWLGLFIYLARSAS